MWLLVAAVIACIMFIVSHFLLHFDEIITATAIAVFQLIFFTIYCSARIILNPPRCIEYCVDKMEDYVLVEDEDGSKLEDYILVDKNGSEQVILMPETLRCDSDDTVDSDDTSDDNKTKAEVSV